MIGPTTSTFTTIIPGLSATLPDVVKPYAEHMGILASTNPASIMMSCPRYLYGILLVGCVSRLIV